MKEKKEINNYGSLKQRSVMPTLIPMLDLTSGILADRWSRT
jgi:hypothetical protein